MTGIQSVVYLYGSICSPLLDPPPLEDLGELVEPSQAVGDVIIHVGVIDPQLGLGVGQRRLCQIRSTANNTKERRKLK